MSDALEVGPDEGRRELWLFALHVSNDDIGHWEPPRPTSPPRDWPLEAALGVGKLVPAHVEVFEVDDLGKYGLRRYLADAHGMDADEVDADAANLDRLHGTAVLVFGGALTERPNRFAPELPLRFIGHYRAAASLTPASSAVSRPSTKGQLAGPAGPGADPAQTRRALTITLIGLIALAILVWALA